MEEPPRDQRVIAMMAVLFGQDWEKLEGDVAFEKTSVESWVLALETMLKAADGADPIRVAIRGIAQESDAFNGGAAPAMPTRSTS